MSASDEGWIDLDADGAALLDDAERFLGTYVAFPSEHARVAVTLWAVHAHLIDASDNTPRLALLSPEPGSGKTRVLEVLERLGLLARIDTATLVGYCVSWATLRATTEDIAVNGLTLAAVERELEDGTRLYRRAGPNPAAVRREKALGDLRAFSAMFGFSPADRSRVPTPDPDGDGSDLLT